MKKRVSFVSNSSSSSFIVSEEDNKHCICFNEYDVLSLKDYCEKFIRRDIFNYDLYNSEKLKDYNYVSDAKFSSAFSRNIHKMIPITCKKEIEDYLKVYNDRPDAKWDSKEYKEYYDKLKIIENVIVDKCYQALKHKWDKVKFHFAEIESTWNESQDEDNETLATDRIEYINELKPLVFYRTFCNH